MPKGYHNPANPYECEVCRAPACSFTTAPAGRNRIPLGLRCARHCEGLMASDGSRVQRVNTQEFRGMGKRREEKRLSRKRKRRDRANSHKRKLLEVASRKALRVAKGLIKLESTFASANEV